MNSRKNKKKGLILLSIFILLALVAFAGWRLLGSAPLTFLATIASGANLNQSNDRINGLVLGIDRRTLLTSSQHGLLTDTIMLVSYDIKSKSLAVVSLPRDLWVPYSDLPPNLTNASGKINSVYATCLNTILKPACLKNYGSSAEYTAKTLEKILGLPIHYYAVIGFDSFVRMVDILGGVDIEVRNGFDDYMYPIPGLEDVLPEENRYEHLHFEPGWQHFNGQTALKFARSRKALGPEGSDFARSTRQQQVVAALKSKALSLETLTSPDRLKSLYSEFSDALETNVSLGEALEIAKIFSQVSFTNYYVMNGSSPDDPQLLYDIIDENLYDGQYVLVPKAGDYSALQDFFAHIFEE
ncbi:hypothetical protein COT52_00625 [candidate division WWE3 bacterium CG08_land_8_20_14_0_20_43_13]|uniref:Cell envelope-related transcriptional attenuator domain-containing protein n=1 Tax=candidate division WWE3 bacterium CG08_land_8_20_14_0_20_43_13 TaxID=1975087 RepID=A0A2H0X812_UNCKA|nr:MAG: hypothetical protein COT52_00625 [candidate division WWE3 bacterium CG08_land_8_20_14_0_20_43_13]